MSNTPCICCGQQKDFGQFWSLSNYYGITGRFCSECYEKVSHDSFGKPNNPTQYTMVLLRMGK